MGLGEEDEALKHKLRVATAIIDLQKKRARAPGTGASGASCRGRELMRLVEERDVVVPLEAACAAVNVSRASLYRSRLPTPPPSLGVRAPSPRRIPDSEREAILATFHSPEFVDQPPQEVFATLLSRGR